MKPLLYCVWSQVPAEVEDAWIEYMDKKHILDVLNTKLFISAKRLKVLDGDTPGNYVLIFELASKENFDTYLATKAKELREDHIKHFGDKVTSSRMVLEEGFSMNF